MALPIKLIVGPDNIMQIPLEAQSLDITVDRNASAFPTPNNIVGRIAIDTNIPSINIEIGGILQDDDGPNLDGDSINHIEGGDVAFNFSSAMPTRNLQTQQSQSSQLAEYLVANFLFDKSKTDSPTSLFQINNVDLGVGPLRFQEVLNVEAAIQSANTAIDTVNHPSAGTYSAGSTSIVVDDSTGFTIKDRIHLANGTFVGTLTGISSNTLTFSTGIEVALADGVALHSFGVTLWTGHGQVIGSIVEITKSQHTITHIKLDQLSVPVYSGVDYYITATTAPPVEDILNNKQIALFPNYWRIDRASGSNSLPLGVYFVFSTEMAHSDYQNQISGGAYPSITQQGWHIARTVNGFRVPNRRRSVGDSVIVKVPIGGISTHSVNGNPASTLALIVKKALELTTDAMESGYLTSGSGQTIASAFSVIVSGPMLKVIQKDKPIGLNNLHALVPCYSPYDPTFRVGSTTYNISTDSSFQMAVIEYFIENYVMTSISAKSKSAGDKVQDLIGIISNAKKNRDLIRGIQIPYDSLVQSDAVTPTARNFFLTFGEQDDNAKGSLGNTLNASHKMIPGLLPGDLGGDPVADRGDSFFDNIVEFGENVQALGSFVKNFIGDTLVTLFSDAHGNDGGIRIIPEKFHVRYDAGNKYYAFNLTLKASDFVIGV